MTASPPAVGRLPRGRHKLDPQQVVATQRRRIFAAMAAATAEKGYAATTVADVLSRAGVSRETFYQQFESKQDCFGQAFDQASDILFAEILAAAPADRSRGRPVPAADRFDAFLGSYLEAMAGQPQLARLCLVEVYAAGPELVRKRAAIQDRFADSIALLFGATDEAGRFACQALVSAVASMVTTRLALDQADRLTELRAPLSRLARTALNH